MSELLVWLAEYTASVSTNLVLLATSILIAAALISRAIHHHTNTLILRHPNTFTILTVDSWRTAVEQILADLLHDEIDIASFSGMSSGRSAWIRFVARDGRAYVFANTRRVRDCAGWGRRINTHKHRYVADELQAIWHYFMHLTAQSGPIARNAVWYLLPAQTPQHKARPIMRPVALLGDGR